MKINKQMYLEELRREIMKGCEQSQRGESKPCSGFMTPLHSYLYGLGFQMSNRKKELKSEYKQNQPAMGVYQIRNLVNEKVFIGVSFDMQGVLNRHQFSLKMGDRQNKKLQDEWNEYGSENFVFER
jgi:hypothetical protein